MEPTRLSQLLSLLLLPLASRSKSLADDMNQIYNVVLRMESYHREVFSRNFAVVPLLPFVLVGHFDFR